MAIPDETGLPARPAARRGPGHRLRNMRRLAGRFFTRRPVEWWLLLRALALVAVLRLALWVLPLPRTLGLARRLRGRPGAMGGGNDVSPDDLIRATRTAGRLVPGASCLTQALACHVLLGRAGCHGDLMIGVRLDAVRRLEAHAWLERDGTVLIGALPDLSSFTPMPSLQRHLDGPSHR